MTTVFNSYENNEQLSVVEDYQLGLYNIGVNTNISQSVEINLNKAFPYNLVFPFWTSARFSPASFNFNAGFRAYFTIENFKESFKLSLPLMKNRGMSETNNGFKQGVSIGQVPGNAFEVAIGAMCCPLTKNTTNVTQRLFDSLLKFSEISYSIPGATVRDYIVGQHFSTALDKARVVLTGTFNPISANTDIFLGIRVIQSYAPLVAL